MKTDSLRINQLSPQAYRKYLAYLQVMDDRELQAYGAFLADDCEHNALPT